MKHKKTGIRPTKGKALIQLQKFYADTGPIIVPQTVEARTKCEAKLLAFTPLPGPRNRPDLDEALEKDAVIICKPYSGLSPFSRGGLDDLCVIAIEDIEAWSPQSIDVERSHGADGAVPRCKFCGPAVPGTSTNAMMMVEGPEGYYCPRCHKDKNGRVVDPDKVVMSEDQLRAW